MAEDFKKWECVELKSDVETAYRKFFDLYAKDRLAARLLIMSRSVPKAHRVVAFRNGDIHIVRSEMISYGVSVTLRMYKSAKVGAKYYINSETGLIARSHNGKFIPCKASDITDGNVKKYLKKIMPWVGFIFKLNLPVTFTTIVNKKLYSTKKLLSWYWGTNYPTAQKLDILNTKDGIFYGIRKNLKTISNITNLNNDILVDDTHRTLFAETFILAIRLRKTINAAWSFKRLQLEHDKMVKEILHILYSDHCELIEYPEKFKSAINAFKKYGFKVPITTDELIKLAGRSNPDTIASHIDNIKNNSSMIVKYNDILIQLNHYKDWNANKISMSGISGVSPSPSSTLTVGSTVPEDDGEFHWSSISSFGKPVSKEVKDYITLSVNNINLYLKNKIKMDARKAKLGKIINSNQENSIQEDDEFIEVNIDTVQPVSEKNNGEWEWVSSTDEDDDVKDFWS